MRDTSVRARFRSLSITDFRGIDRLEIELPPDDGERAGALVLAGDNGVGKTSVLEAILLLFGRVDLLPADTASPRELVRVGAVDFHIEGILGEGTRTSAWFVDRPGVERLDARLRRSAGASSFGTSVERDLLDRIQLDLQWGGLGPSNFAIEYFSARREPEDLGGVVGMSGRRVTRGERRFAEIKRRLANVDARNRMEHNEFTRIETFMRTFLGERWKLDVMFRADGTGSDAEVVVRDGELPDAKLTLDALREQAAQGVKMPRVVPIDRLSSGQMAMLAMTYPFVFGDRVPDLVLIDEPEQHLHVNSQGALLTALRTLSPTTQFIVTTHSPWVLDAVPSYERRELIADDAPPPHSREAAE